jgi:hypothetical protein
MKSSLHDAITNLDLSIVQIEEFAVLVVSEDDRVFTHRQVMGSIERNLKFAQPFGHVSIEGFGWHIIKDNREAAMIAPLGPEKLDASAIEDNGGRGVPPISKVKCSIGVVLGPHVRVTPAYAVRYPRGAIWHY